MTTRQAGYGIQPNSALEGQEADQQTDHGGQQFPADPVSYACFRRHRLPVT
ncbi:MAG: hypothetical protein HN742_08680 [Lentisphaerae bacterium]|nr:hypothetical protein [Lentisphaerota bacterium]MBT5610316.1 hypothetical protein [Lentisphaerota bacterium]MBT7056144.1 hypothetical protein [Lentisphaerota bacterium]MBT7841934.1 hypothetical protein [Lentisphaerota bacterium]